MRSRIGSIVLLAVIVCSVGGFAWHRASERAASLAEARGATTSAVTFYNSVGYSMVGTQCVGAPVEAELRGAQLKARADGAVEGYKDVAGDDAPAVMDLTQATLNAVLAEQNRHLACLQAIGARIGRHNR